MIHRSNPTYFTRESRHVLGVRTSSTMFNNADIERRGLQKEIERNRTQPIDSSLSARKRTPSHNDSVNS